MTNSEDKQEKPIREIKPSATVRKNVDEPMEDEEKILAGRVDVNMPALLTKDVQGG